MRTATLAILLTVLARGQEFEVASVKPSGAKSVRGSEGGPGSKDPTHYSYGQADLGILIMLAYNVENFQVSSRIPLDRDFVDLVANVPAGATREQFRAMLRNLLETRFNLKAHIESREFSGYELSAAKGGAKLTPSTGKSEPVPAAWLQNGFPPMTADRPGFVANNSRSTGDTMLVRLKAQQQPLSRLTSRLRSYVDGPVVDGTGLAGNFDFMLEFSKELPGASADAGNEVPVAASLTTVLQQQLGLQIVKKKLMFDVVVVDAVDRSPSAN